MMLTAADRKELQGIHPDLVAMTERAALHSPVPFRVQDGLRTRAEQAEYVRRGTSKTMNSRHLTGHAVDLVPLVNGKPEFEDWTIYNMLIPAVMNAARDISFEPRRISWDGPHYEIPRSRGDSMTPTFKPLDDDATFAEALAEILKHEGGFVNHPRDPGGATNKGITLNTYRRFVDPRGTVDDIRNISDDTVARIYRTHYWSEVQAGKMPRGVGYAVFDFAVNSGPKRSAEFLQKVVGADIDGVVGPQTLGKIAEMAPADIIDLLCDDRLSYLKRLPHWGTFGNGWTRRVEGVRETALDWAKSQVVVIEPEPAPDRERTHAEWLDLHDDIMGQFISVPDGALKDEFARYEFWRRIRGHPPDRPMKDITPVQAASERPFLLPKPPEPEPKGGFKMSNYSKLFGSIIGGLMGLLVTIGLIPPEFNTPEVVNFLVMIAAGAFGTWIAPANTAGN